MRLFSAAKMGAAHLSPVGIYYLFTFWNTIAFSLLAGNIITLYALRLGADPLLIGILNAMKYLVYVGPIWGRGFVTRLGAVRQFGLFWMMRYVFMVPIALTFLPALRTNQTFLFALICLCVLGYYTCKGMSVIGYKLIMAEIAPREALGAILSNGQTITSGMMILTGIVMGLLLYDDSPLHMYTILIAAGIVIGLLAATLIFRYPEPLQAARSYGEKLSAGLRKSWEDAGYRTFLIIVTLLSFATSMTSAFEILYFKQIYLQPDNVVIYFTVIGYLGGMAMSVISGRTINRVGTRSLMRTFFLAYVVTLGLLIWSPVFSAPWLLFAGLSTTYFFMQVGISSQWTLFDIHFFSITAPDSRLNLTVVYGLTQGIASILGALAGGMLLDNLPRLGQFSTLTGYRLLFGIGAVLALAGIGLVWRLPGRDKSVVE